ncbi:hypothetical protein Peur_002343 [Populus x canadensis]
MCCLLILTISDNISCAALALSVLRKNSLPIIASWVKWQAAVESCAFSILYFFDSPVFHSGIALCFLSGTVSCLQVIVRKLLDELDNSRY